MRSTTKLAGRDGNVVTIEGPAELDPNDPRLRPFIRAMANLILADILREDAEIQRAAMNETPEAGGT